MTKSLPSLSPLPDISSRLLPGGIDDRLPPIAFARQKVMSDLLQFFYHQGFDFIDPPLVEYATAHKADATSQQSMAGGHYLRDGFISFDPLSGQPLVIRADMTSGVARIAADKLSTRPRPLKLCYGGDVLRATAINGKRQLTQVGVEIIGGGAEQNKAVLNVLFAALDNIIARPLWCDLALPVVTRQLLQTMTGSEQQLIENHVRHKDLSSLMACLQAMKSKNADLLIDLMAMTGLAVDVLPLLKKYKDEPTIGKDITSFIELVSAARQDNSALQQPPQLSIDLTELLGFDYKTGFAFTLFDQENKVTVGRGGHYTAGGEEAVGFSLYLDNLLPMIKPTILSPKRK